MWTLLAVILIVFLMIVYFAPSILPAKVRSVMPVYLIRVPPGQMPKVATAAAVASTAPVATSPAPAATSTPAVETTAADSTANTPTPAKESFTPYYY
jgi:hypothetical protein